MSYFTHLRPEIQVLIPVDTKRLLDVGCGAGMFSLAVKNKTGCEAWGIEPVASEAKKAARVLDYVRTGFFEDVVDTIDVRFDVICFNDVLEHMQDPYQALRLSLNLLNPKGMVIASMPNILHYQAFLDIVMKKDFKYTDAGIMDRTHLRWFTRKSMVRMFEECGYEVQDIIGLDPTPSRKMDLISFLSFGYFNEMRYPQFAILARMKK